VIDDQVAFVLTETVAGIEKEVHRLIVVHCKFSSILIQADEVGPTEDERRKMTLDEVRFQLYL
jgi:hypothetical protein